MSSGRRTRQRRGPGPTPARPWQPMQRASQIIPPEIAAAAADDPAVARVLAEVSEVWRNDRYLATVRRRDEDGSISSLSIRRADRKAARDWRDFQQIKNDIAGTDTEAVELYPAEARLVDTSNQFWLWCYPPGERFPGGFSERVVSDEPDPRFPTAKQRPLTPETESTP